jgi:SAM-dependent methyltransferase
LLISRALAILGSGSLCYACNNRVGWFLPFRGGWKNVSRLMIALDVIGSNVGKFACPRCGAHDRERHLLMYFDSVSMWANINGGSVLHFAPERIFAQRVLNAKPAKYIKADLFPSATGVIREDITKLSFADGIFDLVIANHILEHVIDDNSAMKEVFRVLKPGGFAILQTPYSNKLLHTFSDDGIIDDEARLQAFGQEDHVRLYGKDLFVKLEKAGFESRVATHAQLLSKLDPDCYGVNAREPFMCYQRTK